ncbi:MAG: S8 family serine peptidase [Myxococcota bacterium]|nr:S8 family serine peptidase [Myxococcota bacterium]
MWDATGDGLPDAARPIGEGVRVCIIDSGLDLSHPELRTAYVAGRDFLEGDDDPGDVTADGLLGTGHGTHVAGIIAARPGQGGTVPAGLLPPGGVVGVAPGVELLVARVLDPTGQGTTSDVIAALAWCQEQGAHVVSLSLGASEPSPAEAAAFTRAWEAGMLLVAASGNDGEWEVEPGMPRGLAYPAGYPEVMAVGAVALDTTPAPFSQTGPSLSLVAPGVEVLSSLPVGSALTADLRVGDVILPAEPLEGTAVGGYSGSWAECGQPSSCAAPSPCPNFVALVELDESSSLESQVRQAQAQGARAVLIIGERSGAEDKWLFLPAQEAPWPLVAVVPACAAEQLRQRQHQPLTLSISRADYGRQTGTSVAAPFVTGVAALIKSAHPELTAAQLRAVLEGSARDLGIPGNHPFVGHGLVQAKEALRMDGR